MNILCMCCCVIILIILTLMNNTEHFNNIDSVTAWSYPEEAVKLSEENINVVAYNPEGVTPFFGYQNPIGAEIC